MHLIIFHYHLLPGGVTQVITSSVISILKYVPAVTSITIVCGQKNNTDKVLSRIKKGAAGTPGEQKSLNLEIIPEIGYSSEDGVPVDSGHLVKILLHRFTNGVWWIHNFQLGKNPAFTRALLTIAENHASIRMVLQIHDFPECARYEYIKRLKQYISGSYYPVSQNVRYAVINSRDRKLLTDAGISASAVFLLNNPLEKTAPLPAGRPDKSFEDFFTKTEPSYLPGHPVYIYPVRAIRRKNVLEAGLLTRLLPEQTNLFVTLPGISDAEKDYSKMVESAFTRRLLNGVFASGQKGDSAGINFIRQISSSSVILSSSIQEGFGYLYFNALQWKKPLFARYLDILGGTETIFKDQRAVFYNKISVPLRKNKMEDLRSRYLQKINSISEFIPEASISSLKKETARTFAGDTVDFSFLSAQMQISFLENLKDISLLQDTRAVNKPCISTFNTLLSSSYHGSPPPDLLSFTLQNHAKTVIEILNSFNKVIINSTNNNISKNLLSIFTQLGYLKLLYD